MKFPTHTESCALCSQLEIDPDISGCNGFIKRRKVIDKRRDTSGVQEFQRKGFAYDGNNFFYVVELDSNVLACLQQLALSVGGHVSLERQSALKIPPLTRCLPTNHL